MSVLYMSVYVIDSMSVYEQSVQNRHCTRRDLAGIFSVQEFVLSAMLFLVDFSESLEFCNFKFLRRPEPQDQIWLRRWGDE